MAVKLRLLFVLPALAAAATAARADDPKDPWAALDFLIGSWTGSSAVTQGTDTFGKALDGKVMTFEMAAPGHTEAFRVIAEGDSVRAP